MSKSIDKIYKLTALTAALYASVSGVALAQQLAANTTTGRSAADVAGLETVTVTAEYRNEDLQKTPVAVTIYDKAALSFQDFEDLRDLNKNIPNLFIPVGGLTHSSAAYYIRGIGESDSLQNQTVATYVDDIYIPRPTGGTFELVDTESIQVLRGPQGTLYGRNSSAGAIKITTAAPSNDTHYFAEAGYGDHDATAIRVGLSGPIVENTLTGGVSVVHRYREGLVHDLTLNSYVGKVDSTLVRAKLNYTPFANLELLYTGDYFKDYSDPTPVNSLTSSKNPNVNFSNRAIWNETDLWGNALTATYHLSDNATIKSISSYRGFHQPGDYDQDGSATDINHTYSLHQDQSFSEEVRLNYDGSDLHGVLGFFYFLDRFQSYRTNYSPTAAYSLLAVDPTIVNSVTNGGKTVLQFGIEHTASVSGYGELTYDVTTDLHLIGGARITSEQHDFTFTSNEQNAAGRYLNTLYTLHNNWVTWNSFSPKLGVSYDWTSSLSTYFTFSKGFKGGGFDGRATTKATAQLPFEPEIVTSFEGGAKTQWFDDRVRANLAVFFNKIKGYQATATDSVGLSHRINLGTVETKGFELETTSVLAENLTWVNNLAYLGSKVTDITGASAATVTTYLGKIAPNAPLWSGRTAIDYTFKIEKPLPGSIHSGFDVQLRSKVFTDGPNTAAYVSPGQYTANAAIGYTTADKHWDFTFNVKNIFDKQWLQSSSISSGNQTAYFNEPRLFYFRLKYSD